MDVAISLREAVLGSAQSLCASLGWEEVKGAGMGELPNLGTGKGQLWL